MKDLIELALKSGIKRYITGDRAYWCEADELAAFAEAIRAEQAQRIAELEAAIAASAQDAGWIALTDADRERAFNSLPDMLDGFLKKWGWLHFAQAIEDICREKNAIKEPKP